MKKNTKNETKLKTGVNNNLTKENELNETNKLYDNIPNPFDYKTEIAYELQDEFKTAYIMIFNLNGTLIKQIPLTQQNGTVTILAGELKPGMYHYSLIVDNKIIDTKKMLLTY